MLITADSQLVDVGQRYRLDASGSIDPFNQGLEFFWTLIGPPGSNAAFDDHCEDAPEEICDENFSGCAEDPRVVCSTNADCESECRENIATTSPDCSVGQCEIGGGRELEFATFVADLPGPYTVRALVQTSQSNDTGTIVVDTYPSLWVIGSAFAFGGTGGALIGELAEVATFADDAASAVAIPSEGNLLLAVTSPPRIRKFDFRDGSDLGIFGETRDFVTAPVALAFDASGRQHVADVDGTVSVFDTRGRFIRIFGDVAAAGENVVAMTFSPTSGELLVVDGGAGAGIRRYDGATGAALGVLGETATAVSRALDLAFAGTDPATDLFIADVGGDLVRCDPDGTGCASFADAAALLSPGGPTAVAVNPSADVTDADVVVADALAKRVIACELDGTSCMVFGDTAGLDSDYVDIVFAPPAVPDVPPPPILSTTTSTTTTMVP